MNKGVSTKDRIKAIPTEYRGAHFQSRLEARWAIIFDLCGVEWVYEPEVFNLGDNIYYKPDFLLKGVKGYPELYCEVKGIMDPGSAGKINQWLLGDIRTRKKSVMECLKYRYSHGWRMDYPAGEAEVIRPLLLLGKIPMTHDIDKLDEWVKKNYPRTNHFDRLFYSSRTFENSRHSGNREMLFPFPAKGGGMELVSLSHYPESVDPSRIQRLKEICFEAVNHRFDY